MRAGRRAGAGLLLALFLMILGAAVSPQLHKWLHHDADQKEHSCAVTWLLMGGSSTPPCAAVAEWIPLRIFIPANIEPARAPVFYISCFVPDHAPPRFS